MKGLIAYLSEVDKQFNQISNNDELKSWGISNNLWIKYLGLPKFRNVLFHNSTRLKENKLGAFTTEKEIL